MKKALCLLFVLVFIYYFVTFSILYIFKVIDKIDSLNNTIKLLEKDTMVKDALFKLTHEIKNPLAVCKGYLEMIYDKVLVEKIDTKHSDIILPETNEMIGRVVKVGPNSFDKDLNEIPLQVKINDIILIKDNVSTPIRLNGKDYFAIEEKAIVGIIKENAEITFINESILMKPYHFKKLLNSTILEAPDINYEDLDYSEVYNRDLFKIEYIDGNVKNLQKDDIVLAKRDFTNYVYLNQEKYFLLNGKDYIEAKLETGE